MESKKRKVDDKTGSKQPKKDPSIFEKYRQVYVNRFSLPKYAPVVAFAIMLLAVGLAVYFIQKPTLFKSHAANPDAQLAQEDNQKLKSMAGSASPSDIAIIAEQRKNLMLKLAKEDPQAFVDSALDQDTLNKLPQVAKDAIEKRQTLSGTAALITIQTQSDDSTFYQVEDDKSKKRYEIHFTGQIPDVTTGKKIEADSYTLDDQAVSLPSSTKLLTSNTLAATNTPISRNILAIRVLLSDNKNQTYSTTETNGVLYSYSYSARNMHYASSYGLVNYTVGAITPYLSIAYSETSICGQAFNAAQTSIDQKATAAGYNLAAYKNIVYLFPLSSACGSVAMGSVGGSPWDTNQQRVWYYGNRYSSASNASIFAHELGHNLGMHHADTIACGTKAIAAYSGCTIKEYGDSYDTIGYQYSYYPEDNGAHKYLLGYFNPSNVLTVTPGSRNYTIYQLESNYATTAQVIKIPKSTGDYYFLDARKPLSFDSKLPTSVTSGATLYIGLSNVLENGAGYRKTYLIDTTPGDGSVLNSPFVDGRSFSDPASYLTIKQVSHTTNSVTLTISYVPPTPTPTPTASPTPTPTLTPTPKPTATPTVTPIPDNTPPTVSITSPTNGALISKNTNITISATATDNIGVAKVEFYVNGSLRCTDTGSPYTCAIKVTGRTGSTYNITAKAYDKSNNTAMASVSITSN